jgi:hypothetical protein
VRSGDEDQTRVRLSYWITVMHLLTLVWNVQKFITSLIINENSHTPSYGGHRLPPDWLHPKWRDYNEWCSREQQLSTNQYARKIGALRATNMNNQCGHSLREGFSRTVDGFSTGFIQKKTLSISAILQIFHTKTNEIDAWWYKFW